MDDKIQLRSDFKRTREIVLNAKRQFVLACFKEFFDKYKAPKIPPTVFTTYHVGDNKVDSHDFDRKLASSINNDTFGFSDFFVSLDLPDGYKQMAGRIVFYLVTNAQYVLDENDVYQLNVKRINLSDFEKTLTIRPTITFIPYDYEKREYDYESITIYSRKFYFHVDCEIHMPIEKLCIESTRAFDSEEFYMELFNEFFKQSFIPPKDHTLNNYLC